MSAQGVWPGRQNDHVMKQDEVAELLRTLRMTPGTTNRPVLGVNILMMQRGKNGGFPKHLYHEILKPVVVFNEDEQTALAQHGYVENYIVHSYPKYKFRRNMDAKFTATDFVEDAVVANPEAEKQLLAKRMPAGCRPWVDRVTDVEALPEAPEEDPVVTIARLRGQLAGIQGTEPSEESKPKFRRKAVEAA